MCQRLQGCRGRGNSKAGGTINPTACMKVVCRCRIMYYISSFKVSPMLRTTWLLFFRRHRIPAVQISVLVQSLCDAVYGTRQNSQINGKVHADFCLTLFPNAELRKTCLLYPIFNTINYFYVINVFL